MYESIYQVEKLSQVKREELLRAAEKEWLAREASLSRGGRALSVRWHPVQPVLSWLGNRLVAWGERLQKINNPPDCQALTSE